MLSYRHGYHAGNFADCLKHITLTQILTYLKQKDKPIFYLDTHAGAGEYSLVDGYAVTNSEHRWGIDRLLNLPGACPAPVTIYLDEIRRYQTAAQRLQRYPGSPCLAASLLRTEDRLELYERHPTDFPLLRDRFCYDRRVRVLESDGFHAIQATLPPLERRGLILIDPSYETEDDYSRVFEAITAGVRRFASGTYALWYPILDTARHARLLKRLEALRDLSAGRYLALTLRNDHPEFPFAMRACGMFIINPPYLLEAQMRETLPWLVTHLTAGKGSFSIQVA